MKTSIRIEGLGYFHDVEHYNRRALLEREVLYLPMNCIRYATDLLSVSTTTIGMAALLAAINPVIAVVVVASSIPDLFSQIQAHRLTFEGLRQTMQEERKRDYYRSVLLSTQYAGEVRIYDLASYFVRRHVTATLRIWDVLRPIRRQQLRQAAVSRMLCAVGIVPTYLWAISSVLNGRMSIGNITLFMTAIAVVQQQLARAAQTIAGHRDTGTIFRELISWMNMKSDIVNATIQIRKRNPCRPPKIKFENVSFKYPDNSAFTLDRLNLEIQSGKCLALVGRNGSGKSTLVKLLCRLYEPEAGLISYDGVDIRALDLEDLRRSVGVIFQEFMRYELTVRENITLGDEKDPRSCDRMRAAAQDTAADDFIKDLPLQYETGLGKEFHGGTQISGGQWQRIALARALFRDAGLLVLDEPTAAVDVATESMIYRQFSSIAAGKTSVLITHRLSSVRMADEIAVIDAGHIVEIGDHHSLMAKGGLYRQMFDLQAERYRGCAAV